MDRAQFRNLLVALNGDGLIAEKTRHSGIDVLSLCMSRGLTDVWAVTRLVRILQRERPLFRYGHQTIFRAHRHAAPNAGLGS